MRKKYPGVYALKGLDLEIASGEVHVLVGENGAGKSTLVKVLKGDEENDGGKVFYHGKEVNPRTFFVGKKSPISVVYQEFTILPELTVAENIFLGNLYIKNGLVDWKRVETEAEKILLDLGCDNIDPKTKTNLLSVAQQQIVEIAKAFSKNPEIIILDEPTTTFSNKEIECLFKTIRVLTSQQKAVIYISHRLKEVFEIGNRVTVLRDGNKIATLPLSELSEKKLIELMIGKEMISSKRQSYAGSDAPVILETKNLKCEGLKDCSLHIKKGEIVGLIGLMGAGHKVIPDILYGLKREFEGELLFQNKPYRPRSVRDALNHGICLIHEDRKNKGILAEMDVKSNICISNPSNTTDFHFLINNRKVNEVTKSFIDKVSIVTPSMSQIVKRLSGGNQQKVIIARLLNTNADLFIFSEPTRGIDIGAKREIYNIMDELVKNGKSILMISSELPEVANVCDRVYVFFKGNITAEISNDEFTQQNAFYYMAGGN